MRILLFIACLLPLRAIPVSAGSGVTGAAGELAALVSQKPSGAEKVFDKSFFRGISLDDLNGILSGLYRANGPVAETLLLSSRPFSGHFFLDTSRNYRIPAAITLDPDSGRISGLFLSPAYRKNMKLVEVRNGVAALPGRKGLLVMRLGDTLEPLEALDPDEYFSVGRAFELYLLGALVKEGKPWDKVIKLEDSDRSLPPGRLRGWPAGSPLTVHTLTALMVSENDATAADALISVLGRRKIEEALPALGHSDPALLRPFLKISEEARLAADTSLALKYLNLPLERKYDFLAKPAPLQGEAEAAARSAFGLGRIGWAASPSDLCRLIGYLENSGDRKILELMSMSPGSSAARGFLYAARSAGSGPGFVSAAWLLKNKKSERFCLAAAWNEEGGDPDAGKFSSLMASALEALAAINGVASAD